ncbi:insulinase family protein [Marinimicrobium alkaliphilum]|uniref:insulinase family protein n=1 Tax=Marinimicrobium alkaliphilum TaxID=2202654 RepID=UPI000DB90479|nr:insulinase family protein [Marinimicrobium alkaliphilum]
MTHNAFEHLRSQRLDALNLTVEEYRHKKTGAQHIHLAADNDENVFLVALRTVPHDHTGVAHILEHTALCGSEKYPVRDPFFMMIRRSLNTFMNAFTSSDWTAYPFASQNRKDFDNLLDVYLDAVFFSKLDELDFAQEGHRVDFAEPGNPDSPLVFKGVVYNEMKGAMSSVSSQLWQVLSKYLYPNSTYHYNSGGEPEHIPDLTYDQLVAFYKTHYHPSNAIFMTYGDIPAAEHQAKFEAHALHRFDALDHQIGVTEEKRYHAPVYVEEAYPLDEGEDPARKSHLVMGWLLGKSTDLEGNLAAQLLANVLLDNSASPLLQVLETSDLGQAPSPLCGMDDSQYEMAFVCGLEGCRKEDADAIEQLILGTLQKVADEGVPADLVEAALHQLELQQREITGDGFPYGLHLIMTGLTAATHRGDTLAILDLDSALASLRAKVEDPDYIQRLTRELLLDNPHRIRLTLRPDTHFNAHRDQAEQDRLAAIKATLSDADKQRIIERAEALDARQNRKDDDSILPKVGLEDIPAQLHYTPGEQTAINGYPTSRYTAGTNGLAYQQVICKLPALEPELRALLPFYNHCLTELGIGAKDYLATQRWQASTVGALSAATAVRGAPDDVQAIDAYMTLSSKALSRQQDAMDDLIHATLHDVRFDELDRIRELMAQTRARREQSITGGGHGLAMGAASAGLAPAARLSHELGGLAGIAALKKLDDNLSERSALAQLAEGFAEIHRRVQAAPKQFLLVGEAATLEAHSQSLAARWQAQSPANGFDRFALDPVHEQVREGWLTNTQVNFCAKAYPTVPGDLPDAPALSVLGGVLRNGFLHRAIREQGGAYGGGASQDSNIAAFRFFSYRDPRLSETLDDFDRAIDWLLGESLDWQAVEEAILGVISSIDKPASPAGEAKKTFHAELFQRTRARRERFREGVLRVTQADLRRVAETYLKPEQASIAVVTHSGQKAALTGLGLDIRSL